MSPGEKIDCRVFEQLIYKWEHSIDIMQTVLIEHFKQLLNKGGAISSSDIRYDVEKLLRSNFSNFIQGSKKEKEKEKSFC